MFDIKENLKNLPDCPGVYMHKDKLGKIIYVGKAVSIRNRVRQYFQSSKNMAPKVRSMVSQICEFEYITTGSEMEALILECNLIKKYRPKYNILLRDDKTYPYIKITNEKFPRVIKTRTIKKDGGKYYGPYSDVGAVNMIVDLLNDSFELKRCSAQSFPKGSRPCLNYHINRCRGICNGFVDVQEYAKSLQGVREFLSGKSGKMIAELNRKMNDASEKMKFEDAARYRDFIEAAKSLSSTQRVVMHQDTDIDIVIPAKGSEEVHLVVFFVREGKLIGRETYEMESSWGEGKREIVSAFINQHYSQMTSFPKEILLTHIPEDKEVLEQYLSSLAGHHVKLVKPQKGEKKALVDMAFKDVVEMVKTIDERAQAAKERRLSLGKEIFDILCEMGYSKGDYQEREYRVEAYDISNTNGVDTVGAMVVFDGLRADRKGYRKFRIKTVYGQDDYASMKEMLQRRLKRVFKGDEAFEVLPDIMLIDGGRGHVDAALEVMDAAGLDIPVVGMVKDDKHRTKSLVYRVDGFQTGKNRFREIPLEGRGMLFRYIGRIQEEVHRFAIEYHRNVRNKHVSGSVLDEIKGIGPVRRKRLLERFKSVRAIRAASQEELEKVPGMDAGSARSVWEYFHPSDDQVICNKDSEND